MKKLVFLLIVLTFSLKACGQIDQTFTKPVYFNAGFYLNGYLYLDIPSGGIPDWNAITNKPLTFPPAIHNHDLLYKSINWLPKWGEIQDRPQQIPLQDAIEQLGYLPIPERSTIEINSIILPAGKSGIVKDTTLGVYKLWNGTAWLKIVITSQ